MEHILYNNIDQVLAENARRRALLDQDPYDPLTGVGCWGDRVEAGGCLVPRVLLEQYPAYPPADAVERDRLRIVEDFEFWCARCVTIKDKESGRNVPLLLNRPQRRLLGVMEGQRQAGEPIRVILLKARQWGGSTLVQMYMAWLQLVRHKGWNSLICGHKHITSKSIKRMYNLLLRHYPRELLDEDTALQFTKLEGQPNVQQIEQRDCLVLTGSARSEDIVRGYDIAMAHLSEVAFWPSSAMHSPTDVVRSVCGSVMLKPETVVVLESTANGVGDFFHSEWLRAVQHQSDKEAVFVPWHEIDMYSKDVSDAAALWESLDEYERTLWSDGLTLEQINWYHLKRLECPTHAMMMAEYPTNASEAFATSGFCPFPREDLDRLEKGVRRPLLVGDICGAGDSGVDAKRDVRLFAASNGRLKVWEEPEQHFSVNVKYLVVVDIGGRSDDSDYSVIAVWRCGDVNRKSTIVAQWRGHIDHDQLGWKALQLAVYYRNAQLVIESNTLTNEAARTGESDFILEKLRWVYDNVYRRPESGKLGFHTNIKTKQQAVASLIEALRDDKYIERDIDAVNEMRVFEEHSGHYGARIGKHDDIVMTRAIGLMVMEDKRSAPGADHRPPDKSLTTDRWQMKRVR